MKRYSHSKSNLFLMELMIDILLFCLLCVCALLLFSKSAILTRRAANLHHGVSLCSGIAAIYESEEDAFPVISREYPYAINDEGKLILYYDSSYIPCAKESAAFYIMLTETKSSTSKLNIEFYTVEEEMIYSITACKYTPLTAKEVNGYE